MIEWHPALPFFIAACLIPFLPAKLRQGVQIAVPILSFGMLYFLISQGVDFVRLSPFPGVSFILMHFDRLALFFAYAILTFSFLANIYALHAKEKFIHVAANLYAGSSLGAVLAGDLGTLFVFWEMMAMASTVLIWNKARPGSASSLLRYFLVHLTGGLFLFSGILLMFMDSGSFSLSAVEFNTAGWLIFIGFCVNAALVPLHAWLPDAYPEGTPMGSVYLSAFTTKVAVYAFARVFAGADVLIWLGVISAVYGVIFALMENDMRRLLSYHIVCQIGYMICGIGLGSDLGINAGTAHAVGNILFKGLLFMATGALIHRTGKYKLNEMGGLFRENKMIFFFFMTGALAISGFPFLNGYISKVLLLKAAGKAHMEWLELILLLVTVGTFMSIALKLAFFAFWGEGKSSTESLKPCPLNMYLAMAGTAFLCVGIGIFPRPFYALFPFPQPYSVYTPDHILHTFQLLIGTLFAFWLIVHRLHMKPVIALDVDWLYRRGALLFMKGICEPLSMTQVYIQDRFTQSIISLDQAFKSFFPSQSISSVGRPLLMILAGGLVIGTVFFLSASRP